MKMLHIPIKYFPHVILTTALSILIVDYLTGPDIRFTILYVVPIGLAAWKWKISLALVLALSMPLFHLGFAVEWNVGTAISNAVINMGIQWSTLVGIALLIAHTRLLQQRVRVLEGILPICCFCKKIKNQEENWEMLENYISRRSDAQFSHSYCPTCARQHYPDLFEDIPRTQ